MRKFDALLEKTLQQLDEAIPGQAAPTAPTAGVAPAPAAPAPTAGAATPAAGATAAPAAGQGDEIDAVLKWAVAQPPANAAKYSKLTGDALTAQLYKDFKADPKNAQQKPAAGAPAPAPAPAAGGTPAPVAPKA